MGSKKEIESTDDPLQNAKRSQSKAGKRYVAKGIGVGRGKSEEATRRSSS